jgi:RND family efflux transporter MFP subunit
MTRSRHARATAVVALMIAASGCGGDDSRGAPPPPEVVVAVARLGAVPDRHEYVGNVRAAKQVDVRARVRGILIEQAFRDGQFVEADQLLFRIDPSTYEVALAEAKGELAAARAEETRARLELDRARELSGSHVVSESALDARRADDDTARARVATAAAAVRGAELDLSYCTIRAPLAGRISQRFVDVGNLVGRAGEDTLLAQIVEVDPIHVYFEPTEQERLEVLRSVAAGRFPAPSEGGLPVEFVLGDGTPYAHRGVVDYVAPTIEPTRGTVTARALVPNPNGDLKPGEFVRVYVVFPDLADVVLVPQRAILEQQGGSYVLVVGADDVIEQRGIVVGALHEGMQGVSGVEVGERVVVEGVQKARPGTAVVPRSAEGS